MRLICGSGPVVIAFLLHRTPAWRRLGTLADLNILIMDVHKHLADIARIEPLAAGRAFFEIVGLGLGDAVWIVAFHDLIFGFETQLLAFAGDIVDAVSLSSNRAPGLLTVG